MKNRKVNSKPSFIVLFVVFCFVFTACQYANAQSKAQVKSIVEKSVEPDMEMDKINIKFLPIYWPVGSSKNPTKKIPYYESFEGSLILRWWNNSEDNYDDWQLITASENSSSENTFYGVNIFSYPTNSILYSPNLDLRSLRNPM